MVVQDVYLRNIRQRKHLDRLPILLAQILEINSIESSIRDFLSPTSSYTCQPAGPQPSIAFTH